MFDRQQSDMIARQDWQPMAFAGLWESWRKPGVEVLRTYRIVTTSAITTAAQRQELRPGSWSPQTSRPVGVGQRCAALMRPAADDLLWLSLVSWALNSVRNKVVDLLAAIDGPHALPTRHRGRTHHKGQSPHGHLKRSALGRGC